ncbi:DUF4097 domain-containing protein [Pseudonocardia kujensis]|uniref:DUF4097 family beta strand repeat-containing protein n=1 Tax=Pseudonocardia kujensis TaxID=1128675 RepID=UPI001E44F5D4|nr:DUF4097 family beta strand repeat-containing protein [Pseudonocardia kujensis]MCE0766782.1 DUF4097 domain-containing protein [Pseudonocardia kujensis]
MIATRASRPFLLVLLALVGVLLAGCGGATLTTDTGSGPGTGSGAGSGDLATERGADRHEGTVARVAVVSDAGDVTLRSGPEGASTVDHETRWTGPRPELTQQLAGGVLRITAHCPEPGERCETRLTVTVPAGAASSVDLGAGDVVVSDLTGEHELRTAGGDVTGTGLAGPRVSAHSTAGDVELTFAAPPTAVVAESTAGDVGVLVPLGPVYRVDAGTTVGSVEVGVADDPGAAATISAHSTAGDVRVAHP